MANNDIGFSSNQLHLIYPHFLFSLLALTLVQFVSGTYFSQSRNIACNQLFN